LFTVVLNIIDIQAYTVYCKYLLTAQPMNENSYKEYDLMLYVCMDMSDSLRLNLNKIL
jgi:hypothetical protein